MKSFSNWVIAGLASLGGVLLLLLAYNWLPGLPEPAERNVSVFYPPGSQSLGVSLFVQPPVTILQVQGESQSVSLQFTNRQKSAVSVQGPSVFPGNCFELRPSGSTSGSPFELQPNQTLVRAYELHLPAGTSSCLGQHPLSLQYSWLAVPSAVKTQTPRAGKTRGRFRKRKQAPSPPAPVPQQASVTTGPIRVISANARAWERFYHALSVVAAAILLPVLLALFNANYQRIQSEREIWKAIFPGILILVQQHYLPISRRIQLLRDSLGPPLRLAAGTPIPAADSALIFERVVLFRAQTQRLSHTFGGYHFRSKPGEELCGTLAETFWFTLLPYDNAADYERFAHIVEVLFPKRTAIGESIPTGTVGYALALPTVDARIDPATNPGRLQAMSDLLWMFSELLGFECDRPLYPEWYPEAPEFRYVEFGQKGEALAGYAGLSADAAGELRRLIDLYLNSIPRACRR